MEDLAAPETLEDMYAHLIAQRSWLARLPVDTMSGCQAGEVLEFGARLERLGVAIQMVVAPKVSETYVWKQEGHKSAASYLAEKTGTSEGRAQAALETARQLAELPETALYLAAGAFSAEQVKEIASAASVHPGAEGELIEAAARSGLKGLKVRCQRTKALASFEMGEEAREKAIHKSRFFRHRFDPDGGVRIEARLTPADGARILEAVKAKAGFFYDEARRAGCYESESAYRADGLVALADDAVMGRGTGIARPSVILRVNLSALQRGEFDGARDGDEESAGDGDRARDSNASEMCEIAGVGPVSLATATRVLGDAYVKLVVSDGIDVRSVCLLGRAVPASLQTALEQRDPVCSVPRCENHYYLENHHLVPVAHGGPTSLDNLVRICKWHHDLITYERWRLRGRPGQWTWHPPPDFDGLGPAP